MAATHANEAGTAWRSMIGCYSVALRRMVFTRIMLANLMLALLPVAVALLIVLAGHPERLSVGRIHLIYEGFLRLLYLHFVVFFSANVVGFLIMRQDIEEKTLHYVLLQPVSRWVIVAGRLLAFLTLSTILCLVSFWLLYFIFMIRVAGYSGIVADLFGASGRFMILCRESGVLTLGLVIYGSIAMLMSSFIKTAFYAVMLLGWESLLPYLPSSLKYFTASHYLQSLLPVAMSRNGGGLFELLGEPATPTMSLTVLLTTSLVFFLIAAWFFQRRQCLYGES